MDGQGGNKGLWVGCIMVLAVAIVFIVLWAQRGGEVKALKKELASSQSIAESTRLRLERELRTAVESGERKTGELETRLQSEKRRADDAAQQMERRFRNEQEIIRGNLDRVNAELAELRESAEQRSSQAVAELQARLDAVILERDRLAGEASTAKGQREAIAAELAAARQQLEEQNVKLDSFRSRSESAATQLASAKALIDQAGSLEKEVNAAREGREAAEKRVAELEARVRASEAQYAERIKKASASADERLRKLEKEFQEKIAATGTNSEELRVQVRDADRRLAEQETEWRKRMDAAKADWERAAKAAAVDAVRNAIPSETVSVTPVAEDAPAIVGLNDGNNGEETAGEAITAEVPEDAVEPEETESPEEAANPEDAAKSEETVKTEVVEWVEPPEETPEEDVVADLPAGEYTIVTSPNPPIGEIVELLSDGKTYLITAGAAQGLVSGAQVDVYRETDQSCRYVARLEIFNVLSDEFSMAFVLPAEPMMVCPATGRAVRSGVEHSPFAVTREGGPLALRRSNGRGMDGGVPAVGDVIVIPR